jgi:hypothetical protein
MLSSTFPHRHGDFVVRIIHPMMVSMIFDRQTRFKAFADEIPASVCVLCQPPRPYTPGWFHQTAPRRSRTWSNVCALLARSFSAKPTSPRCYRTGRLQTKCSASPIIPGTMGARPAGRRAAAQLQSRGEWCRWSLGLIWQAHYGSRRRFAASSPIGQATASCRCVDLRPQWRQGYRSPRRSTNRRSVQLRGRLLISSWLWTSLPAPISRTVPLTGFLCPRRVIRN